MIFKEQREETEIKKRNEFLESLESKELWRRSYGNEVTTTKIWWGEC